MAAEETADKIMKREPLLKIPKENEEKKKEAKPVNRTKNGLVDLHDHLFMQLERLNDEELTGDALKEEMGRAKAISGISGQIIANANLMLKARMEAARANDGLNLPPLMLKGST